MRHATMYAFRGLLKERVPIDTPVLSVVRGEPVVLRDTGPVRFQVEAKDYDLWFPRVGLMANAGYRLLVTDTGLSRSDSGNIRLTAFSHAQYDGAGGMCFFLKQGKLLKCLTPHPLYDRRISYRFAFDGSVAASYAHGGTFSSEVRSCVAAFDTAERREVTVKNETDGNGRVGDPCLF